MPNITASFPLWFFDLDNTLHNASHAVFPSVSAQMDQYIAGLLGPATTPAGVAALRQLYWQRYGATLLGMIKHHRVSAADFLHQTHAFDDLPSMLRFERGLARLLRRLPGRKILLTNAPTAYSRSVVKHLGLQRHFSHHIAIEDMQVHGQLRPKPSKLMLQRLLRRHGVAAHRTILVEDTLENLRAARQLGMRTAWVTQYLRPGAPTKRPAYVDVKVKSVRQLPACLHRLR